MVDHWHANSWTLLAYVSPQKLRCQISNKTKTTRRGKSMLKCFLSKYAIGMIREILVSFRIATSSSLVVAHIYTHISYETIVVPTSNRAVYSKLGLYVSWILNTTTTNPISHSGTSKNPHPYLIGRIRPGFGREDYVQNPTV